jgi:hypothetical protein
MRTDWMEKVETLIELFPLADDVVDLWNMERDLVTELESSANAFRLELMSILDA